MNLRSLLSFLCLSPTILIFTSAKPLDDYQPGDLRRKWIREEANRTLGPFNELDLRIQTDHLLEYSLRDFEDIRHIVHPDEKVGSPADPFALDWRSDECKYFNPVPITYDFRPACHRQDFARENFIRQGRFTPCEQQVLDRLFVKDCITVCDWFFDETQNQARKSDCLYWASEEIQSPEFWWKLSEENTLRKCVKV